MIGGDLPKNDDFTLKLLTNAALLEIEKAAWCAHPIRTTQEESIWFAPRKDGKGYYAAAFNLSDEERTVTVPMVSMEPGAVFAVEIWGGKLACFPLTARLEPHDVQVYRIMTE